LKKEMYVPAGGEPFALSFLSQKKKGDNMK